MHQLSKILNSKVLGVFTDTIIVENLKVEPKLDTKIGGVRDATIPKSEVILDCKPRNKMFLLEKPKKVKLNKIDKFELLNNKGCFITGPAGTGKSTLCNKLKSELKDNEYKVCTPTQKSALLLNGVTFYSLFNIDPKQTVIKNQ